MKRLALKSLEFLGCKVPLVARGAHYIALHTPHKGTYPYYRQLFIANGRQGAHNTDVREEIVRRFENIDQLVPKATTPTDGLVLAEAILSMDAEGDLVECGCYAGASSAKLSILARLLRKNLVVFDSFEGLPDGGERVIHARRKVKESGKGWQAGAYSAGLDAVQSNVESLGEISVCRFVQGWFQQTLSPQNLPDRIAAAFTDVDMQSSARDCLVGIWPQLSDKGIFFSHDVAFITVLQELLDEELWKSELKSFPPIFFGAGFGVCDRSPHLGYMVKGVNVSAQYLKRLTLEK